MKSEHRAFTYFGNIALVNFPNDIKKNKKIEFAKKIIDENKSIKTVLEKSSNFKGRLRKMKTKHLAGEKNKEILYKENNCIFRFNIDSTYFSPRLSNERKEIAQLIKKNEKVLVMFAGVAPFSIVIAKNSHAKKVYSNEINRVANKYSKLNIKLNKLENKVELLPGDAKKMAASLHKKNEKFDVIVMARPQLKNTFLEDAFKLTKKGTRVYYYDFCQTEDTNLIIEKVKLEAKKANKKIKIINTKKAGEIAPYKIRFRVDFKLLN